MSTVTTSNGSAGQAEANETDRRILAELERRQRVAALRASGWTVALSGGQTATLIDPEEITERRIKACKVAMMRAAPQRKGDAMDAEAAIDSSYVLVAAFLAGWTLTVDLPSIGNPDTLLDLKAKDFRLLSDAVADVRPEAFPDYGTPTPEALADPHSPLGAGSA